MATMDKINDLYARRQKALLGGGEERIKKQHESGKKPPGKEFRCYWILTVLLKSMPL